MPEESLPPVFDNDGAPQLVVGGKRYPFTLGRIKLLEIKIAKDMQMLDSLKAAWAKESGDLQNKEK